MEKILEAIKASELGGAIEILIAQEFASSFSPEWMTRPKARKANIGFALVFACPGGDIVEQLVSSLKNCLSEIFEGTSWSVNISSSDEGDLWMLILIPECGF
ncbi:MAG: hypothetical protein WCW25_02885 [Patescibacteria group bacterium]|jgi:hypothetical protein